MMGKQTHGTCSRLVAYLLAGSACHGLCKRLLSEIGCAGREKSNWRWRFQTPLTTNRCAIPPLMSLRKRTAGNCWWTAHLLSSPYRRRTDGAGRVTRRIGLPILWRQGIRWRCSARRCTSSSPNSVTTIPAMSTAGPMRFLSVSTAIIPCRMGSGFPISWGGSRRLICSRQPFLPRGLRNSAPA